MALFFLCKIVIKPVQYMFISRNLLETNLMQSSKMHIQAHLDISGTKTDIKVIYYAHTRFPARAETLFLLQLYIYIHTR